MSPTFCGLSIHRSSIEAFLSQVRFGLAFPRTVSVSSLVIDPFSGTNRGSCHFCAGLTFPMWSEPTSQDRVKHFQGLFFWRATWRLCPSIALPFQGPTSHLQGFMAPPFVIDPSISYTFCAVPYAIFGILSPIPSAVSVFFPPFFLLPIFWGRRRWRASGK